MGLNCCLQQHLPRGLQLTGTLVRPWLLADKLMSVAVTQEEVTFKASIARCMAPATVRVMPVLVPAPNLLQNLMPVRTHLRLDLFPRAEHLLRAGMPVKAQ